MEYRIVKRSHENKSIADKYVVQCLDKNDDWYSFWSYSTLEEAEEYVDDLISKGEQDFYETVLKEYSTYNESYAFAEEYFFNSFKNGSQTFFGERFDVIKKNLKGMETPDKFDVVMLSEQAVGIVEVKFRACGNDISKVLNKAVTFRENFPYYATHRVYLGYATFAFNDIIEQECIANGIAIIKQVGDTVVINDKHLKVF